MRELRLSLLERLGRLEKDQYQIASAMVEVHRRLYVLAQVKSWSLPGAPRLDVFSEKWPALKSSAGLMGNPTEAYAPSIWGYCLKCRTNREIKNATLVRMKRGRPITQGFCVDCNTKMATLTKASS